MTISVRGVLSGTLDSVEILNNVNYDMVVS